ncbi:MAG: metallophosphoesterase [Abditibacteriota bacterium]|nr:metallophosphoesterase [Abditibacteriota bacterium]
MSEKEHTSMIVVLAKNAIEKVRVKLSEGVFEAVGHTKTEKELTKKQKAGYALLSAALIVLALIVIVLAISYVANKNFKETFYQVGCGKVEGNIRIVHLSDLHDSQYGKDNARLLKRIRELKPDIICMTGDMTDHRSYSRKSTMRFFKKVAKVAPTYYIYGNNEWTWDFIKTKDENELLWKPLVDAGIHLLQDRKETLKVGGNTVDIYGILHSSPKNFWSRAGGSFSDAVWKNEDDFKLTLIHEPYLLATKPNERWGDLVLAGHTHGGVVNLPKFGPIYEHEWGVLPVFRKVRCFMSGEHSQLNSTIIVSTGLTNRGLIRVNNRPELVIIDVNRY